MTRIDVDLQNPFPAGAVASAFAAAQGEWDFELVFDDVPCFPNRIVPVVAVADAFRRKGCSVALKCIPGSYVERVCKPFVDGAIEPEDEDAIVQPFDRVWSFSSAAGQCVLFNALLLQLTKSSVLGFGVKESFMWCLNEVMDNVLNHAAPDGGARGYVMAQYHRNIKRLAVCVFDLGIGLKASLDGSRYSVSDSHQAILAAVKAGVTSGNGQGNGLWGLRELLALAEDGTLYIASGDAAHRFQPSRDINQSAHVEPLCGFDGTTLVDFQFSCVSPIDFDAVFGSGFAPVDLKEEDLETEDGAVRFAVADVAIGTGTRESARGVRNLAENVIDNAKKRVVLDFKGVDGCSSSFIDELVGKLLLKYGFLAFSQMVSLRNVGGISARLVNRSIAQRLSGMTDDQID